MARARSNPASVAVACLVLLPSTARADDQVDQPEQADDAARHRVDRSWLYTDDAQVAAPMTVIGTSSVSYTNPGSSPSRIASPYPNTYDGFAANTAQPGAVLALGAEVGLLPRVSAVAVGQMDLGGTDGVPSPSAGALAGVRVLLSPSSWQAARLAVSGGYVREAWSGPVYDDDSGKWRPGSPNGDDGVWVQLALSGDLGRLRVAGTLHGEHIFWAGRDPLDVMVELGASYRILDPLRVGIEYVGQDLEESFSPGAEGGARHFLGPTASLHLFGDRLSMAAGPAVGLSSTSPQLLGRLAVSYGF